MRVWDNGTYRDMTPEEVEVWKAAQEQAPAPAPTAEERLDALEAAIKEGLQL